MEGRTVRDIVEHDHERVDDAWCRKLFRQLLQSLERQYAMDMPHRAITADTVVFHQNGEPLLLASIVSDPTPEQADDLSALARLVHYAITQELIPTGPLQGRGLAGYSDALLAAVDRCMDPDPERRPHTIAAMRDLLGLVAPGSQPLPASVTAVDPEATIVPAPPVETSPEAPPETPHEPPPETPPVPRESPVPPPVPPHPAPAFQTEPVVPTIHPVKPSADTASAVKLDSIPPHHDQPHRGLSRWQRWSLAGGGAAILLAIALVGVAELRDTGSLDPVVLALPQNDAGHAQSEPAPAARQADQPAAAPDPGTEPPPAPAPLDTGTAPPSDRMTETPAAAPALVPPAASPGLPTRGASYKLQIQPWGTVYVDGVDRGVSPPVKRLVLAPGRHTVRVTNPNFNERVFEIDTAKGDGRIAIDFNADAQ